MAATRPEIESSGIRKTTEFYGNLRRDWAPYSNGSKREEIWNIAFSCARACNQYPSSHEPDSALADFLKRAKATNTPIVLLVDTWSLKIAELMRQVEHYDNFGFSNSAALVVWDEGPDTEAEKDELQELVAKAFDDNLSRSNPRFFRHSVSTRAALSKELRSTLQHLRMNIINRGFPLRLVSGPRPLPIP
jgi:FxsC-like protein